MKTINRILKKGQQFAGWSFEVTRFNGSVPLHVRGMVVAVYAGERGQGMCIRVAGCQAKIEGCIDRYGKLSDMWVPETEATRIFYVTDEDELRQAGARVFIKWGSVQDYATMDRLPRMELKGDQQVTAFAA